ncbi:MAG TPA: hypothetical protein DDZ89_14845, partial [Clostridiales bacterium]|nr:hypothetical protein [Clostridiales bacterium]
MASNIYEGSKKTRFIAENNVTYIKAIRKQNLPYIFVWIVYYAWVIAFATWWTDSPLDENVFSTQLRNLL